MGSIPGLKLGSHTLQDMAKEKKKQTKQLISKARKILLSLITTYLCKSDFSPLN